MDDHYIYVFIRQDLSVADQLVHASHAVFHMASLMRAVDGVPSVVVIGIPHEKSMSKVLAKLYGKIAHFSWSDPDFNVGVTAVATVPLSQTEKQLLSNYRLYSLGAVKAACLLTEDEGAKADVAQLREHPVFNRGVEGVNPSVGSKLSDHEQTDCGQGTREVLTTGAGHVDPKVLKIGLGSSPRMTQLRIVIELGKNGGVPTYTTEPDELCTIIREVADRLEKVNWSERDYSAGDRLTFDLRSFEGQKCGTVDIR